MEPTKKKGTPYAHADVLMAPGKDGKRFLLKNWLIYKDDGGFFVVLPDKKIPSGELKVYLEGKAAEQLKSGEKGKLIN